MKPFYFDVDSYPDVISAKLYEANLKDIKADSWSQVKARVRSQKLKVTYKGVDKKGFIHWDVTSGTTPGLYWHVTIQLLDLEEAKRSNLKDRDKINLAVFGNLKVHCNCHAFKYYFQYVSWVKGYSIYPEMRYPKIRNPKLTGSTCKHTLAVLNILPMWINTFVRDFRKRGFL